jgi:hypothetical protein
MKTPLDQPHLQHEMDIELVDFKIHWQATGAAKIKQIRRVSMEQADAADQKRFLEAVLKFKWLSSQLRRAITSELGRSVRKQDKELNYATVATLRVMIEERKALMRKRGEKPRGGIHNAALEQVAAGKKMTVDALKKKLERYPPTPELRRHLKKIAVMD